MVVLTQRVEMLVRKCGERLPLLVDWETGLPDYDATAFVLQQVRGRGLAANTIEQVLRAIARFNRYLKISGVDLEERFREGRVFSSGEIEGLARTCQLKEEALSACERSARVERADGKQVTWTRILRGTALAEVCVSANTTAIRLGYSAAFLRWLGRRHIDALAFDHRRRSALQEALADAVQAIEARCASKSNHGPGKGLRPDVRDRLLEVIQPDHPENPWRTKHGRERNRLIVLWLYDLGLRRGELAGLRISRMSISMAEVHIDRRADDPTDPRKQQPNAKTLERQLELKVDLTDLTRDYVLNHRRNIRGARKHDFLFVSSGTGAPISLVAINKIFERLRQVVPGLPEDLSPHKLRHDWNDRYSETVDATPAERRIPESLEQQSRNYAMGWSMRSKMSEHYSRRSLRKKTNEVILEMQRAAEGRKREKTIQGA
ncbi:MAG TPA: site-specific integrase [Nevskia sp.]|nr:site-specific integrase [Nevskia sp.]